MSEQHTISAIAASNGINYLIDDVSKSTVSVDNVHADVSLLHISQADYEQLVAADEALSNTLYVVSADYVETFGQQIKNLAPGTELSDAVNFEQLSEVSARAYGTYTQSEVDQKIASAQYFKKYVVQTLPSVADADERGIYLVPSTDSQLSNTYDEYVVVGEGAQKAWEKIGAKNIDLSGYKTKQTAKTSPAASSTTTSFIDTITQNENGEITATKKTVQSASTSQAGIVQLNNTLTSTSTAQAATANAVKLTNDKFADYSLTSHVHDQYLTAVPTSYKTYADTKTTLSGDGYVTGVKVNGTTKSPSSGVVDIGTVLTAHQSLAGYVPTSRTVAGYQLTGNVTAANISSAIGLSSYVPTSRKVNGKQLTADITLKPADVSALALSGGTVAGDITLNGELTASGELKSQGLVSPYIAFDTDYLNGWSLDGTKLALIKNNYDIVVPNVTASDSFALASQLRYKLATATGTLSSGSYVYDVEDRSVTTIGINQSSTPVIVRLPNASGSGARDFILRIEISSSSAPSFTFTNSAGLDFDSEDDDWAVMEPGLNIVSFTETKR